MMNKNIYLNGIMGFVTGDAVGCPVEFVNREELEANPISDMGEYGTFNMPKGTWTDDSSMTMATLDALRYGYDINKIQDNFVRWLYEGKYTPAGVTFDVGEICKIAITRYEKATKTNEKVLLGLEDEFSNGNGSLMRILPVCLYVIELVDVGMISETEAISMIHEVSAITHAHMRSKIACGLYFFIVKEIVSDRKSLFECVGSGITHGFEYYKKIGVEKELTYYSRLVNLEEFKKLKSNKIKSSGYVVDSLEATVWSLINTNTYKDAILKAVNLGGDTDTIGALTGGLAGLYYGLDEIPKDWIYAIQRREWIEKKCDEVAKVDKELIMSERRCD